MGKRQGGRDRDREEMLAEGQLRHPARARGREMGKLGREGNEDSSRPSTGAAEMRGLRDRAPGSQRASPGGRDAGGVGQQRSGTAAEVGGAGRKGPWAHMGPEHEDDMPMCV